MSEDLNELQNAYKLNQLGRLIEAASICEQLISRNSNNFDALHLLGTIKASLGEFVEAQQFLDRSLGSKRNKIAYLENYASILFLSRDYERAVKICRKAIKDNYNTETTQYVLAIALYKQNNLHEAIQQFDLLLSLFPNHLAGNNEKGSVLAELKRYDEALSCIENALRIDPRYAGAFLNKGNVLGILKKFDASILAYKQALAINPNIHDAHLGSGNVFRDLKRYDEAFAAYDKALALKPDLENAWLGRGNLFFNLKRYDEAFAAYDKALALKPDLENAWLGRGNLFFDLKRYDEAFAAYDKALALKPDLENAWLGRGNVFYDLKRYDEAIAAYDKALALKPDLAYVEGLRLYSKMLHCDWRKFDEECNQLIGSVRDGKTSSLPFTLLAIPSSADDQLQCARLCIAETYPPSPKPNWRGEGYNHDRIRVAYLSPDFRQHATSVASIGMFECHDKSRFEITAISIGPDDKSELRKRLVDSFERFIDAKTYGDDQIAVLIRELEIDILVDLAGFTRESRTSIFARRPAPIQVNYLGYPGTMGASYIDYLIADQIVIPEDQRDFYAEKIVSLPNSYHVTDDKRFVSDSVFTRNQLGLPSAGFVFCCFNNNFKITPHVFDCWMRILKSVDGSVLWLFEGNATAADNLRRESVARGVNAERLIFGTRMPLADHLARHRLADLCLDTYPYNAHSIATDALWAGLPLLTCRGETFAGRVAASLLTALSLPELITTTLEDYEALAVGLAMHPARLEKIKQKLVQNRLTMPLFNTKLSAKHIETAYTAMYERHQAGLAPDHIAILS